MPTARRRGARSGTDSARTTRSRVSARCSRPLRRRTLEARLRATRRTHAPGLSSSTTVRPPALRLGERFLDDVLGARPVAE